jgi:hypothetical protein
MAMSDAPSKERIAELRYIGRIDALRMVELMPLLDAADRERELTRENGHLQAACAALVQERDRLRARVAELEKLPAATLELRESLEHVMFQSHTMRLDAATGRVMRAIVEFDRIRDDNDEPPDSAPDEAGDEATND